ncbi:transcriptional regulator [Synechococcales cyanobacterium C]|uniref:Transcriptional regulator n=1 Tax=Petrachloros mirabilis ULC683 TaxID=2781853 RepID=A0A8K1ZXZ3_9CYAN|nr:transcriptional regulator [Petrachloros mirabilis]NCJ06948.1 transcriptional regulator [Petrachloros mirabilis ULC683]
MPKSRAYQDELMVYLQDSQRAIAYLNGALEEGDPDFFLLALRNVARARGKTVDFILDRVDELGQPMLEWYQLLGLLKELGLSLAVKETSQAA